MACTWGEAPAICANTFLNLGRLQRSLATPGLGHRKLSSGLLCDWGSKSPSALHHHPPKMLILTAFSDSLHTQESAWGHQPQKHNLSFCSWAQDHSYLPGNLPPGSLKVPQSMYFPSPALLMLVGWCCHWSLSLAKPETSGSYTTSFSPS